MRRLKGVCLAVLLYAAAFGASAVALATGSILLAAVFHLGWRLAYVLFTALSLRAQSLRAGKGSRSGSERRYLLFRRRVVCLQNTDALSFAVLCFASRSTIPAGSQAISMVLLGGLLFLAGVGMKAWAVRCLGSGSYTWRDFFLPPAEFQPCTVGPYRFAADPMYTLGYLHAHGVALLMFSWPGILAAIFDQATMLCLSEFVEKPHVRRLAAWPAVADLVPVERYSPPSGPSGAPPFFSES